MTCRSEKELGGSLWVVPVMLILFLFFIQIFNTCSTYITKKSLQIWHIGTLLKGLVVDACNAISTAFSLHGFQISHGECNVLWSGIQFGQNCNQNYNRSTLIKKAYIIKLVKRHSWRLTLKIIVLLKLLIKSWM